MKIDVTKFLAVEGKKVKLKKFPTAVTPFYTDKDDYKYQSEKLLSRLTDLQRVFYSFNKYALLLIFQGMDAAGKDGAISHVMSGLNPQGCETFTFKQPSPGELDHDFFWRSYKSLPERGRIGIFNRSYYEEVLVVKVHPELLNGEQLPVELLGDKLWKNRYRSIVDIERHLSVNGTKIVKFFLHLSEEEQKKRFLARIDEPEKNWKFSTSDIKERAFWKDYARAYEDCIENTTTKRAPWYIIPADDKENARLIIAQVIFNTLKKLKLSFPVVDEERKKELQAIREELL
jgi:PPK2 family polyphosphate:nucleotide phosphotransferase